jgi:hypothetical protein
MAQLAGATNKTDTYKDNERFGCVRCGAFKYWEVQELRRTYEDHDKTVYVYLVLCTQCGRTTEWKTDQAEAVPDRVKIRESFLRNPPANVKTNPSSDLYGFAEEKVQPRLEKGQG